MDSNGNIILPEVSAEERMFTLRGVEQYVLLRGKDRFVPPFYVYGEPGMRATPFLRTYIMQDWNIISLWWEQCGISNPPYFVIG